MNIVYFRSKTRFYGGKKTIIINYTCRGIFYHSSFVAEQMADFSDESDVNPEEMARMVEDLDDLDNDLLGGE